MGFSGQLTDSKDVATPESVATPQHCVRMTRPFAVGRYAVTRREYALFCNATQRDTPETDTWRNDDLPVVNVTWQDAMDYCSWLTMSTGEEYRLPSEAEWEFACRAGSETDFAFGSQISEADAHHHPSNEPERGGPVSVDHMAFKANRFRIFQMHGNVWEWCLDDYVPGYSGHSGQKPRLQDQPSVLKVIRGGSWNDPDLLLRSWFRQCTKSNTRSPIVGFRVVRSVPFIG